MKRKQSILVRILLCFAFVITVFAVWFGVSTTKTSDYNVKALQTDVDIVCFSENTLYTAKKGQNSLYVVEQSGEVKTVHEFETSIDGLFSSDGILAVSLQDRTVHFLQNGELLNSINVGYPLQYFDYSAKTRKMVFSSSLSTTQNYIFVFENVNFAALEKYDYYVQPINTPFGIGISDADENIYFATYNAKVYKCIKGTTLAGTSKQVFEVTQLVKDFKIANDGSFLFGMQNGEIAVYGKDFQQIHTFKVSATSVQLAYGGGDVFAAIADDGKACFTYLSEKTKNIVTNGVATVSSVTLSKNGELAMVRGGAPTIIAVEKANLLNVRKWAIPTMITAIVLLFAMATCIILANKVQGFVPYFKELGRQINKYKRIYLYLLPLFGLLAVFIYYPVVWGLAIAFQRYKNGVFVEWVFLDNFIDVFTNDYFLSSVKNMLTFLVTDLLKALIVPVIVAELLLAIKSEKSQYAARVLMYVPGILPGVATMLLWRYGIYGGGGVLNSVCASLGLEKWATHDFLGSESTALGSLIFMGFPWVGSYIIVYGALTGIPESYKEAARLEGCPGWKMLFYIDLPMIFAQLKYIFITSFIGSIQDFNRVYLTTEGGPGNATYVPALELYFNINRFYNYGNAAAMGIFLFVIIFICSMFFFNFKKQREEGVA